MNLIKSGLCLTFLASLALAAPQGNGVVMVEQQTQDGKTTTNRVQMDRTHFRAETTANGQQQIVMFEGTQQVVRMVDVAKKTYTEITKADAERLGGMMAQMQEQMKNLPADQRALMEQMMRGRGAPVPAAAPTVQYKATGSDKAGQWTCNKYEGYVGTQKTVEMCTVDPSALGVTAADFDVTRQMVEFIKNLAPDVAGKMTFIGGGGPQGYSGIPVRHTTYVNGKVDSVSEVQEVRHEAIPAGTWDVPSGFRKQAFGPQ